MNCNVNNISELIKQKVSRYLQKPLHKFFYRQRVREREKERERETESRRGSGTAVFL